MRVQITVVVTPGDKPGGIANVESMTLQLNTHSYPPYSRPEKVIANAAEELARRLGLAEATRESEGGRG